MVELPRYDAVKEALLRYLIEMESATVPSEAYWSLAKTFKLTADQLALKRRDGRGSAWENRVQWAKRKLVEDGIMDNGCHGVWCLKPNYAGELLRC